MIKIKDDSTICGEMNHGVTSFRQTELQLRESKTGEAIKHPLIVFKCKAGKESTKKKKNGLYQFLVKWTSWTIYLFSGLNADAIKKISLTQFLRIKKGKN